MTGGRGQLVLRSLVKRFDEHVAVDTLDLEIGSGEFFSLLGASGCGKTTTLRMIAGFERPDAGAILLDGQDLVQVPPHQRPVNTVFQSYALFPFLSVRENVAFGLKYQSASKAETRERVGKALDLVQMGSLDKRKPHQLSGGQQQRVALARALVLEPTVLLLDEPMGALDAKLRKQLQVELRSIQKVIGTTFVYVTHDQEEALTMSDRLAVLRDGRLMQVGTPSEVYSRPANAYVAGFLGTANLYDGVVTAVDGPRTTCRVGGLDLVVETCDLAVPGAEVSVVVRPERVQVCSADDDTDRGGDNVLHGRVDHLVFRGAQTQVIVSIADISMVSDVANVHGEVPLWLHEEKEVGLWISPSAARLLPRGDEIAS
ncbi:MAG: spermidine/putrescine transport system ATP-binding protein [Nocardioidaceae bacterium]|jgi:spermidine/putrescine transport system ATP-binding protein|nr:spermidine/putrescine transport system ATP-binding protein [Nocardioidaceae bacterium]MDX6309025.1 spermidine/putrescine transport system ATP-binding protein [Nocardioidaceae bacterium]